MRTITVKLTRDQWEKVRLSLSTDACNLRRDAAELRAYGKADAAHERQRYAGMLVGLSTAIKNQARRTS